MLGLQRAVQQAGAGHSFNLEYTNYSEIDFNCDEKGVYMQSYERFLRTSPAGNETWLINIMYKLKFICCPGEFFIPSLRAYFQSIMRSLELILANFGFFVDSFTLISYRYVDVNVIF